MTCTAQTAFRAQADSFLGQTKAANINSTPFTSLFGESLTSNICPVNLARKESTSIERGQNEQARNCFRGNRSLHKCSVEISHLYSLDVLTQTTGEKKVEPEERLLAWDQKTL
jgi:hypothetical protein